MPLLFRAIVTMGCVCTVAKEHVKTVLDQVMSPDDGCDVMCNYSRI